MNTINKFEQPNTEQADRRCAFSRSFTRMFDRLCVFLDERIGGASELIEACQSVADRFWHSKLYFPVCFLMLAVFMAGGQPVIDLQAGGALPSVNKDHRFHGHARSWMKCLMFSIWTFTASGAGPP